MCGLGDVIAPRLPAKLTGGVLAVLAAALLFGVLDLDAAQVGEIIAAVEERWVSRAAHKLLGALDDSGVAVAGRVLDAGASTGGFTQVCLDRGATRVYAVDVGHDQLAPEVRGDPRVRVAFIPLAAEPGESLHFGVLPRVDPATGQLFNPGYNQIFIDPATGEELGRREWGAVWPVTRDGKVHLTPAQLSMLLEGINWKHPKRTERAGIRI